MADMQNGHYVSRSCLATRWDEQNCHCQCVGCNVFKHGNMTAYAAKMVARYGVEVLEQLEKKKHAEMRVSISWLLIMIERYEKALKD